MYPPDVVRAHGPFATTVEHHRRARLRRGLEADWVASRHDNGGPAAVGNLEGGRRGFGDIDIDFHIKQGSHSTEGHHAHAGMTRPQASAAQSR